MKAKNENNNKQYREYEGLKLPQVDKHIMDFWEHKKIFEQSLSTRSGAEPFVFYEGPPSVNGMPGIHHVMGRTIKDLFARYRTQKGYKVDRKAGWDTHGLPIELAVEKRLGITKADIGTKLSVEDYNRECRKEVTKYKDEWDAITRKMGYWVDLDDPYITYENYYIESLWALLKMLYEKDMLYKGYTIQPFSPAAGTQLSSHELNMPGCYRMVKDTTATAQFKIERNEKSEFLFEDEDEVFFLAWTTTPWTLPSNTALAVGKKIEYLKVKTFNPYTSLPITVIIAKALLGKYFKPENAELVLEDYKEGDKEIPYKVVDSCTGADLEGIRYEQLLPYAQPEDGDAFRVIIGDFVTTEDGTGIVHIAPSFGADDQRIAKENGIGSLTLVNQQGRFVDAVTDFAGVPVKDYDDDPNYESVDIQIAVKLKNENRAFKVEKHEHSYPHCWRTDKPVIYYPLDSWFIRATAAKDRMYELNKTINWKPASTGEGRFGKWLENLNDWNLSRSRFWGTPLPIWRTEDKEEEKCIGSIAELQAEVKKAVAAGFMDAELPEDFDLHRPYIDNVYLVSDSGKKMSREADLIDVWFDSGAMPYAQWHYPITNEGKWKQNFPADFIAEGVDQTRGWFYTLHAIATMLFDSVAYKNVVSNGLVLDAEGNKMSKRLGNVVDPFETIDKHGADVTRWYIISNSQPWDNLRFDLNGLDEVKRKFFGTLYNTYSFFALYANIDGFRYEEEEVPLAERPEIDRWILSMLNSLIKEVDGYYNDYEPTRAARAIQDFLDRNLSNWYVRLCRRRFWKGDYEQDKIAAYQTLYQCLMAIAKMMAPIAPFYSDFLFRDLNRVAGREKYDSVHLAAFPKANEDAIDSLLEERMRMAQDASSLVLSLRRKEKIKVRQPLNKMMIPVLTPHIKEQLEKVEHYILNEVNVKEIEYVEDTAGVVVKSIKPDFKKLGPKYGPKMKAIGQAFGLFTAADISSIERNGSITINVEGEELTIMREEVDITSEDIPGWLVASEGDITVALDVNVTEKLRSEGNAREFVNKVQNLRKDKDFNVTDRIVVKVSKNEEFASALSGFKSYICSEILAEDIIEVEEVENGNPITINEIPLEVYVQLKN